MFEEIETDAVISLDEDSQLTTDEVRSELACSIFHSLSLWVGSNGGSSGLAVKIFCPLHC